MNTDNSIIFYDGWILRKDGEWIPGNLIDRLTGLPSADWLMRFRQYLLERKADLAISDVKTLPNTATETPAVNIQVTFDTGRVKDLDAGWLLNATLGHIRPSPAGGAPFYNYSAAFDHIATEYVSIAKG